MSEFGNLHGQFLNMDLRELGELATFFRKFPRYARQASAQVINDLAFDAKERAPDVMVERLTIRNRRFVESRFRVQKTKAVPIEHQVAYIGTTATKRFSGWVELERGTMPKRNRTMALLARSGDFERQVKRSARLKPDEDIPKPEDFDDARGGTIGNRIQAMIREVGSGMYSTGKLFIIPKGQNANWTPGLYKALARKKRLANGKRVNRVQLLQRFDRPPKSKRWQFIERIVETTIRYAHMNERWNAAIKRIAERHRPRG